MSTSKSAYLIDIGNTRIKSMESGEPLPTTERYWDNIHELASNIPLNTNIWISSVGVKKEEIQKAFKSHASFQLLDSNTKIPIKITYDTPETLGADRIAAAVGASFLMPNQPLLIIDLGSCITIDLVEKENVFAGGFILPGMSIRLKSMHQYTAALPDLSGDWTEPKEFAIGKSTKQSILQGVYWGLAAELNGLIAAIQKQHGKLTVILSGGDERFFESKIKEPIFVRPNLVLIGLNRIMKYNEA